MKPGDRADAMKDNRISPIETEQDHIDALARIVALMDAEDRTEAEGNELDVLMDFVCDYEDRHFPMDEPDPIMAIEFRRQQMSAAPASPPAWVDSGIHRVPGPADCIRDRVLKPPLKALLMPVKRPLKRGPPEIGGTRRPPPYGSTTRQNAVRPRLAAPGGHGHLKRQFPGDLAP